MGQRRYWERQELDGRRRPQHPIIESYVNSKIRVIRDRIPITHNTTLLDVGCGNGYFSFQFAKICNVSAVDFSRKMLSMNPVGKKYQMCAERLAFEDGAFDIVFCHALLHHVECIDAVVAEMRRVSKKYVVILEPNRTNPLMFLFSAMKKEERNATRFSLSFCSDLAERNRLDVIDAFSHGMMVPNRTPLSLLPIARLFDFKQPLGMTNVVLAKKSS